MTMRSWMVSDRTISDLTRGGFRVFHRDDVLAYGRSDAERASRPAARAPLVAQPALEHREAEEQLVIAASACSMFLEQPDGSGSSNHQRMSIEQGIRQGARCC